MTDTIGLLAGAILLLFRARCGLLLENLALLQQLAALKRRHPKPRLTLSDKLFWVVARRVWSRWKQPLIVVTPETVVCWHSVGFRPAVRSLMIAVIRTSFERPWQNGVAERWIASCCPDLLAHVIAVNERHLK